MEGSSNIAEPIWTEPPLQNLLVSLMKKKKEKKKWSEVIHETQSAHISQKQDWINAICNHKNNVPSRLPPHWVCSNHNGFVATHALGHMM